MLESFRSQALELGAEERAGLVRQIMPTESGFMLLVENDVMEAKTVLLAMGAARPVLLPGEEEQLGRGVSYCATCDGHVLSRQAHRGTERLGAGRGGKRIFGRPCGGAGLLPVKGA